MNNRVFMCSAELIKEPDFLYKINERKKELGQIESLSDLVLNDYLVTLANTAIALNFQTPDFTTLKEEWKLHIYGNDPAPDDVMDYFSRLIVSAWSLIREFFPPKTFGFPGLGLWDWICKCLMET